MVRKRFQGVVVAAMLAFAAAGLQACDDGDDDDNDVEVLSSIQVLDNAGLHAIDVSLNEQKQVPATAQPTARHMQTLLKLTEWPDGNLEDQADALADTLGELAAAVDAGDQSDIAKAGALAKQAHDQQHDFSHGVWEHLQREAGVTTGGGDGHQARTE